MGLKKFQALLCAQHDEPVGVCQRFPKDWLSRAHSQAAKRYTGVPTDVLVLAMVFHHVLQEFHHRRVTDAAKRRDRFDAKRDALCCRDIE